MKNSHFITLLLCFFLFNNVAKANNDWKPIPFLSGKVINSIARVDSFLLVSSADRDSSFIRINLYTNQVKIIRNDLGKLFGTNGNISLTHIGKHLLYKNNDTLFVSHNYGDTWNRVNALSGADITTYAEQNLFFVGLRGGVFISRDLGYTFTNLYTEFTNSYQSSRPLAIVKRRLFLQHANGLRSIHIDSLTSLVYPTSLYLYNMVKINDNNLLASVATKIYKSNDEGNTWTEVQNFYKYVQTMMYDEGIVYATPSEMPVQISTSNGLSFILVGYGMPEGATTYALGADSAFIYGGCNYGLYRKNKSNYVPRNVVATAFYDANQNGFMDNNENPIIGQKVITKKPFTFFTNPRGQYLYRYIFVEDTISIPSSYPYLTSTKTKLPANFTYNKLWFPFVANSTVRNLGLSVVPLNNSNSNQPNTFAVTIFNEGTQTDTATFDITFTPTMQVLSATDSTCKFNANTLQLNTILKPFDRKQFWIKTQVNTPVNNSDTLWVKANITPELNDVDSANNHTRFYQINNSTGLVAQQWALPMDSIPVEFITNKNKLDYVFRYRHDKSDTIQGVTFEGNFPTSLQHQTLKVIGFSHDCSYFLTGNKFTFSSIYDVLPNNVSEIEGTFYVHFSVVPDSTLKELDVITSNAILTRFPHNVLPLNPYFTPIYKKYIPPVGLIENDETFNQLLYPNPTQQFLILNTKEETIRITNLLGEEQPFNYESRPDGSKVLDVLHLNPGMYLLFINNNTTYKFIKQ